MREECMEYVVRNLSNTDTQYFKLEGIRSKEKNFNSFYKDYNTEKKYIIRVIVIKDLIVSSGSIIFIFDLHKSIITDLFGDTTYFGILIADLKYISKLKNIDKISIIDKMKSKGNKYIRSYVEK
jgi:hypothetical protein